MKIALAKTADLSIVMGLVAACVSGLRASGIEQWDEIYPSLRDIETDLAADSLYLAMDDTSPCGMIVPNEIQSPEYDPVPWRHHGRILVIHRLAVHPQFQRRGVAESLMLFAEDYARRHRYDAIRLDAFTLNPGALKLYAKMDYQHAGYIHLRKGQFICYEKAMNSRPGLSG